MKQILLLIAVFTLLISGVSVGQVLPITHYTADSELNPLPSAEVHQVYQDRQGFMWFAIYSSGLVRYDGLKMNVFGLESGLPDLTVWDMVEDPTGRLWVSSNAGVVVSERPLDNYKIGENIRFTSTPNSFELTNVAVSFNRMIADNEGQIWVGTESLGLIRYRFTDMGSFESDTLSTSVDIMGNDLAVRSMVARNDGSVWVAVLGGEMLEFHNGILQQIHKTGTDITVNTLYESPDGTLWGGEQDGSVWKLIEDGEKKVFTYIKTTSTSNIPDITLSSDNTLWISSEGSGLLRVDPVSGKQVASYNRTNGLLGEIVYNVFEDREKNIWIAQSGGVSKLRYNYRAFRNLTANSLFGEKPVLPSPSVNTVLPSSNQGNPCALWAGTSEGGIACINSSFNSEYIQQQDGLTSNWVNGLVYDQSGRLWAGTSRGLNSISFADAPLLNDASETNEISFFGNKAFLSIYPAASVLAVEKLMIHENSGSGSSKESIWFPAYQSVYVFVNDKLYTLDSSTGLPSAIFHAAAFDDKRHLWIGTRDRGIYRSIEPFTIETLIRNEENEQPEILFEPWWSVETGAPSNQIEKMIWYSGSMWVGTPAGLLAIENETKKIKHFITTKDGLRANNATSFAISPATGKLWVGTNQGLAEVNPDSGSVLKTVTRLDGLVDNEVWFYGSVQFDASGSLYYGTAKGITVYNPEEDKTNEIPPKLILTDFISEDIPGERNEFTFEYAALSFGNERQVRYQTRLIGFNEEWSPLKTETRINYTNLSAIFLPKTYQFEVQGFNESGVSSDETLTYAFSVNPPAFLSWWAFFIYALILSLIIFTADRFQRARLIKKERENAHLRETELKAETAIARSNAAEAQAKTLQAENDLKAAELEKARELEIAYHELKATQNRLIQSEKMASLGRLATGIAHEIKNPLNFINNFAEVSRELVDELKEAIQANDLEEIEFILNSLGFNTEKIDQHGKRADAIVRSMMQHSRGTIGELEPVQINNLITEYAELAYQGRKVLFENLDVTIHTELDPSIIEISAMPQKMGQVVQNIIENAIDSTWEFTKTKTEDYKPVIEIKTIQLENQVEIHISDNGPGIPEHIKGKIFEPFFTTKPTGESTGLGLSLSYDIVTQMHNGKLEIGTSELGGASFVISLPVNILANNIT
jgi:signal transduction histidine kinase/ligand-binding sensor domain-containing protein